MIIYVDGGDGTGKTTLGKRLADFYGFEYVDKPLAEFFADKFGQNQNTWSSTARQMASEHPAEFAEVFEKSYIAASYEETLSDFQRALTTCTYLEYIKNKFKDRDVVITRGLLSSYMWNGNEETNDFYDLMIKKGLGLDVNIALYASDIVRKERMIRREETQGIPIEVSETRHFDLHPAVDFAKERGVEITEVDTDGKTHEEVFQEVLSKLSQNAHFIDGMTLPPQGATGQTQNPQ